VKTVDITAAIVQRGQRSSREKSTEMAVWRWVISEERKKLGRLFKSLRRPITY